MHLSDKNKRRIHGIREKVFQAGKIDGPSFGTAIWKGCLKDYNI